MKFFAKSLTDKDWFLTQENVEFLEDLRRIFPDDELMVRILEQKKITPLEVKDFLEPKLANFPDPFSLKDMDAASQRLAKALIDSETIGLVGDYDVDGSTATALFFNFWLEVGGKEPIIRIPDRFTEGYGPNLAMWSFFEQQGCSLILLFDCGTTANDLLSKTNIPVIIVDHHGPAEELPKVLALLNPKRPDCTSALAHMCSVGLVFLLLMALKKQLNLTIDLKQYLDLAALGTVCDVMPLTGVNRIIVKKGLEFLATTNNIGLVSLLEVAGINAPFSTYDLGFGLGPRLNAGSRIAESDLAFALLTTKDRTQAKAMAEKLHDLNQIRQNLEKEMMEQAEALITQTDQAFIIAAQEGWSEGVIGIIASRLKDRYHRNALVIAWHGDSGKGSGRAIDGFDLGKIINQAVGLGLLTKGGGHAAAAGFSITKEKFEAFYEFLAELPFAKELLEPKILLNISISPNALSNIPYTQYARLQPFGKDNEEPLFLIPNVFLDQIFFIKDAHLKVKINAELEAIGFRFKQKLSKPLQPGFYHLVGSIKYNDWSQKKQIHIVDIAEAKNL